MSFLGDLVDSIGTDKAPVKPPKPFQRHTAPSTAAHTLPLTKTPAKALPLVPRSLPPPTSTLKRKAEEGDTRTQDRSSKLSNFPVPQSKSDSRPSTPKSNGSKMGQTKAVSLPSVPVTTNPAKLPPKGSYADIMARAKQAQETRTTSKVGLIKHQATSKEKVSKVAERRREEQERLKNEKTKTAQRPGVREPVSKKRSTSPTKKVDPPKVPRAPRPPMHAPAGYKGTLGTTSKRSKDSAAGRAPKRSRYDEYLGTDEEDNDQSEDDDDGYGYDSEASSDMEAGYDELEGEEATALKAARQDDAHELAFENKLKAEKEERRRRLAAMAKKAR